MLKIYTDTVNSRTLVDLQKVVNSSPELTTGINEFTDKYPRIPLSFTGSEKEALFDYIDEFSHKIKLDREQPFSPFEKLLLAVLWKNGHIDRVQSIMDGIVGSNRKDSEFGVIFRQFGRSLVDDSEPIVDQHTIRAYCKFGDVSMVTSRILIPKKSAFRNSDQPIINSYRKWFKDIVNNVPVSERVEFKYLLDKILFLIGKSLKKNV